MLRQSRSPGTVPRTSPCCGPSGSGGTGGRPTPELSGWFQQVLARTSAGIAHAATDSVQDSAYTLLGIPFVGTDHAFRLDGTRVEAFSGVHADLFGQLSL
ncbi:hypothetical protein OG787_08410 [Streptomyces sp. NBC_00075]|uniref:hypothetical protein n=1 Tax=Streptomyces sp. NBC_00075 TaxID=2975641 RepID=UPI003256720F